MAGMKKEQIAKIRSLVGDIAGKDLANVEIFCGDRAGVFIPSTGYCMYSVRKNHTHPAHSFCYSFDRAVRTVIGGKEIESSPGEIMYIPPGLPHHEVPGETFTRFVAVMIDGKFFGKHAAPYGFDDDADRPRTFPVTEQVRSSVRDFMIETGQKNPGYDELIGSLETRMVHAFLRAMTGTEIGGEEVSGRCDIDRAVEFINANFAEPLTVDEIASVVSLSTSYFSRLFRKETGQSPQEYLIDVRVSRARMLMMRTGKNLTEIAHECGFANSAHFSSSIRKKYGMPPSRLRKIV